MTTQEQTQTLSDVSQSNKTNRNSIAFGALIIIFGLILLAKRTGLFYFHFPFWSLMLLILGIYVGIKQQFRDFGAWVLISLGLFFMIPRVFVFGVLSTHLLLPVLLVLLGIYIILRTKGRWKDSRYRFFTFGEDILNLDVSFGERTAVVTSRNFKGGIVRTNCGETKLNLLQANSSEPMTLDLKVSFGSVEIVVPSQWDVQLHVDNSFASVEDKRLLRVPIDGEKRLLVLTGNCSFGSITVKSI